MVTKHLEHGQAGLSVGRISMNKGFDILARALGRVRERLPPTAWRWVHLGEGAALQRLAAEHGRLVSPDDKSALASAILEFVGMDGSARRRWGERSRRLCDESFLWENIAEGLVGVYESMLDERRRSP
jgi:glycosyltransferase involved in cell wall biosynthesis